MLSAGNFNIKFASCEAAASVKPCQPLLTATVSMARSIVMSFVARVDRLV
jgi:hypothetical protein